MTSVKKEHVYFIGIGGISMSGLAEILLSRGVAVSGTDISWNDNVKHLEGLGVKVNIGHKAENITAHNTLVVYTAAVKADNPEVLAAKELGIETIERAELLGRIMGGYKLSAAVAGTHGKTTTTSMLSEITMAANVDPTLSIGGILPSIGGTTRRGKGDYFVAEACEYCDSFLKFAPYLEIILNIDADHLDYFKDLDHIRRSFKEFANKALPGGYVVINSEIDDISFITAETKAKTITFGLDKEKSDFYAENITYGPHGYPSYDLYHKGTLLGRIALSVPGDHNILNSLGAAASAKCFGIDIEHIKAGLKAFGGTHRRFEYKGEVNGITIYDDYAHHPTEIAATLSAAKKSFPDKNIWCIFQPHTYSRTLSLMDEFANSFHDADSIIITDIYAAREKDTGEVSSKDLVKNIKSSGGNVIYIGDFSEIENYILNSCTKDDLCITMGAGDVYLIGERLIKG